ncbi:G5 and 3D domain-containing protein [Desulfitobacterium chlororespirans]|uniref:3D (Asp-Asp-Asp) domain-containing protein n=1 Tax=Desulfitobacterium chlororespirans DSM 11544 TaxID=1121395 RepID=A0A1M7THR6_9FIRM|nr:3D domain-containing protein [Desulfitobacterium chlororespirans]SHN70221.1 3D (Asp-Asp-Asp) domain-containing protein [Desulfitobacterium chlororespirans DSM 11544]
MYSLPIATYTDYWRLAKNRSLTMGGTLVLAGSTLLYAPTDAFPKRMELTLPVFERNSQSPASVPGTQALGREETLLNPEGTAVPLAEGIGAAEGVGVEIGQIAMTYRIEDVEIPINTEYIESDRLLPGTSQVQEEGQVGVERQVIRTTTIGGELNDEQIVNQFFLNAPKKRVVIQNTRPVERSDVDLNQYTVLKTFEVEATAYTYTGNPTATGVWPREGLIAVDPRVIPLGTEVYVEGYGHAIAADTGGAIKGNIIDVFFPSLQRCIQWGRRPVVIHILDNK